MGSQTGSQKTTKWTVMVYFAGDNNLREEMIWALKDIHKVAPLTDVKVVALFDAGGPPVPFRLDPVDPKKGRPSIPPNERDRRILVRVDNVRQETAQKRVPRFVEPIEKTLKDFIVKNISGNPDEHYMLILSGHGSGAVGEFLMTDSRILG